jgi:hypothetical protein
MGSLRLYKQRAEWLRVALAAAYEQESSSGTSGQWMQSYWSHWELLMSYE